MAKPKKQTGPRAPMVPVTDDPRFSRIHSDPRFALPKRKDNKVVIDSRFKSALKEEEFTKKAKVDRYGRKIESEEGAEELKRYYRLEDEDEESGSGSETSSSEEEAEGPKYDPARGGGYSSSEDESDSEVDEEAEELAKKELDEADDVPMGEATKRFAAVNLDWDNVRAVDLMAAFDSFKPTGGKVLSVTIYPSEFGKERMQREELEGPPREIFKDNDKDSDDSEEEVTAKTLLREDKGEDFDSSKLRKYQLERLRYYYAVVECDSARTARHIYDNCDGAEYETSANFFDLRFIPDDVTFDDEAHDICDAHNPDYKPKEFVTDALQNSKVKLTWDADDQERLQVAKKAFSQKEIEENDLKAYLASSDDESDAEDKEETKRRYRALLGLGEDDAAGSDKEEKEEGAMEITFTTNDGKKKDEEEVDDDKLTTLEKYQKKEKEKKKARKEKMLAKRGELDEKSEAEAEEDLGFNDPFFENPDAFRNKKKDDKKAEKAKRKAAKIAEAEEKQKQKDELELLMMDDEDAALSKKMEHFDIKQVVKAEKAKKGGKKNKKAKKLDGAEGTQDSFKMDVDDPRFSAVFESHEFAIDPTNPRFMKTEGMKTIMEAKRKRRRDVDEEENKPKKSKKESKKSDVSSLVERIKKKAGKA